jgi:hypothetical protein
MSALGTFHCYTTEGKQVRITAVTQVFLTLPQLSIARLLIPKFGKDRRQSF